MSDITPEQRNLTPTPENLKELYESPAGVPPVEERDDQMLVQRLNESIQNETAVVPEEHREDKLTITEPDHSKRGLIAGGIGFLAGLGLAATLLLGGGDKEEKVAATITPTTTEDPASVPTDQSVPSTESTIAEQQPVPTDTEPITQVGGIDLLAVPVGSKPITAERPNGDKITVYTLGGKSPAEKASSAMSLMACYLTTGDNACRDAFSTNEEVQQGLAEWRELDIVPILEADPSNSDLQVVIFEDPDNLAVLEEVTDEYGRTIVSLKGGTLYFGRYSSNFGSDEWQNPDTRAAGQLESIFTSVSFYFETDDSGKMSVARLERVFESSSPYDV